MKKIRLMWLPVIVIMGIQCIFVCSCNKDEELPGITTGAVTKVTDNSACCCAAVTQEGSSDMWEKGICWCTSNNPTKMKMNGFSLNTKDSGSYECALTGLLPNTTYYVRAFATNHEGTAYGNEISFKTPPVVTDIDGNTYHTVIIGDQTWMAENLRVTHYRNGDPIPEVPVYFDWIILNTGAYCSKSPGWSDMYGNFYNYFAVADNRNLAPEGWHVPIDADWKVLEGSVDSEYPIGDEEWEKGGWRGSDAGGNLKAIAGNWYLPNKGATDKFGFAALPAGVRDNVSGSYYYETVNAAFWTSTEFSPTLAWARSLEFDYTTIQRRTGDKNFGASVRCVKD